MKAAIAAHRTRRTSTPASGRIGLDLGHAENTIGFRLAKLVNLKQQQKTRQDNRCNVTIRKRPKSRDRVVQGRTGTNKKSNAYEVFPG